MCDGEGGGVPGWKRGSCLGRAPDFRPPPVLLLLGEWLEALVKSGQVCVLGKWKGQKHLN